MPRVIRIEPKPYCPNCGAPMKLVRPKRRGDWDTFWGCTRWPDCQGKREVMPDGRPEPDDPMSVADWEATRP